MIVLAVNIGITTRLRLSKLGNYLAIYFQAVRTNIVTNNVVAITGVINVGVIAIAPVEQVIADTTD